MDSTVRERESTVSLKLHRNHFAHTPLRRRSRYSYTKTMSTTRQPTDALHASLSAAQMARTYWATIVNAIRSVTEIAGDDMSVLENVNEASDRYTN
jgi:hypothetical protein